MKHMLFHVFCYFYYPSLESLNISEHSNTWTAQQLADIQSTSALHHTHSVVEELFRVKAWMSRQGFQIVEKQKHKTFNLRNLIT